MWHGATWGSLRGNSELYAGFLLFLGEGTEKVDLLLAGGLPGVVRLESTLEMSLDVYVECLRL